MNRLRGGDEEVHIDFMWLRQHAYMRVRQQHLIEASHICILYEIMRRALNFDCRIKIMGNENYDFHFY